MAVSPNSVPLIILAGQSNANSSGIGQAVFAEAAVRGGLFIHAAVNGTSLSPALDTGGGDWSANGKPGSGELLSTLIAQIAAILDPASPSHVPGAYLDRVIWVQGEADSWSTNAANAYQSALAALHAAMTSRFGSHDLVISALSDAAIAASGSPASHIANWRQVQQAQRALAAADPTVHLVDPDEVAAGSGFTAVQMLRQDHVHYDDTTGFTAALGTALATAGDGGQAAISLISSQSQSQSQPAPGLHHVGGTEGDDTLYLPATGIGQAYGCSGTDMVVLTDRSEGVRLTRTGIDTLLVLARSGAPLHLDLISVEAITLTAGADRAILAANLRHVQSGGGNDTVNGLTGDDRLDLGSGNDLGHGGSGNDHVSGEAGHDLLCGGQGNDGLSGGGGSDTLMGGNGDDSLSGGAGNDVLRGDGGADVFVFAPGDGLDHIIGFQHGIDHIALPTGPNPIWSTCAEGTLVTWSGGQIVLDGISPATLALSDFFLG
jgi:Ca2+-binding RTX toxin-like protein